MFPDGADKRARVKVVSTSKWSFVSTVIEVPIETMNLCYLF